MGRDQLWLPGWLASRSFARKDLRRIVARSEPWIQWLERIAKPRLHHFRRCALARASSAWSGVILGLALVLPIPIIGNIPLGRFRSASWGSASSSATAASSSAGYVATVLGLLVTAGLGWLILQGALAII